MNKVRLAVLVSNKGTGSNLRALIGAGFYIKLVIADREDAAGVKIAKEKQIDFKVTPYQKPEETSKEKFRDIYSQEIAEILNKHKIDAAILAGFNRILTKPFFKTFRGKTINVHPGAIPDHENGVFRLEDGTEIPWNQGMLTDAAVTNFLTLSTAASSIHIVTEKADFGPVLKRVFVPVKKNDTVESLYTRLKKAENKGLIEVLGDNAVIKTI